LKAPSAAFRLERTDRLLLGAIVAVACVLRLWDLPLVSITADEGIHGLFARNVSLLDWEKFPSVGLPSVGVRNSALFIYLLAIPNFVVRHPLSGAAFIALLQVLAIILTYRYAMRWFGRTVAVPASVLWTFSPWAVLYARNMWPPSALAPFVLVFIGVATRWFVHGDRRALGWSVFLAFVIPQVHFSGFSAAAWLGLLMGWRLPRFGVRDWLVIGFSLITGLLTWAPWISWQHYSNQWQDLVQIKTVAAGGRGDAANGGDRVAAFTAYLGQLFDYFRALLHTGGLAYWFRTPEGQLRDYFPHWLGPLRMFVDRGLEIAFAWGLVVALRSTVGRLLMLWTFLPVALLAVIRPSLHPHYEFIAYPAPYLIVGLGARAVLTEWFGRVGGVILLAVCATAFTLTLDGWRRYVADGRLDGDDRYQLSYRQRLNAVEAVLEDAGPVQIDVAGPFTGQHPAYTLPFLHEIERRSRGRWPRDPTHVYWMDELHGEGLPEKAHGDLTRVWPYLRDVTIERSWKVGPTRIMKLKGRPGPPAGR
jgi:hypothetical protein